MTRRIAQLAEAPSVVVPSTQLSKSPADAFAPPEDEFAKRKRHGEGWNRIVERVYDLPDPEAEYASLEADLALGPQRAERGSLVEHLDRAARNLQRAHKLYLAASDLVENFKADSEVAYAAKREEANASLQALKAKGEFSKAINNADVESKMALMFPDDFVAHKKRTARMTGMLEHVKKLVACWEIRCSTLQTQTNALR